MTMDKYQPPYIVVGPAAFEMLIGRENMSVNEVSQVRKVGQFVTAYGGVVVHVIQSQPVNEAGGIRKAIEETK